MKFVLIICYIFFYLPALTQIQVNTTQQDALEDSNTQGFFTNQGQTKIDVIDCYAFNDLYVSIDLNQAILSYDEIDVSLGIGRPGEGKLWYSKRYTKEEFRELCAGKDYAAITVFNSSDLEEKSQFLSTADRKGLTRSRMQFTGYKNELNNSVFVCRLYFRKITGTEYLTETLTDGSTYTSPQNTYEHLNGPEFQIQLKNRIKKFLLAPLPSIPEGSNNCME